MIDEMVSDLVSGADPFSKYPGNNYPHHRVQGCNQGRDGLEHGNNASNCTADTVCKKSVHLSPRKT